MHFAAVLGRRQMSCRRGGQKVHSCNGKWSYFIPRAQIPPADALGSCAVNDVVPGRKCQRPDALWVCRETRFEEWPCRQGIGKVGNLLPLGCTPHFQVFAVARHKYFLGGAMAEHQRELEIQCMTSFPGSCIPTNDFAEASAHQKVAARRVAQQIKSLYQQFVPPALGTYRVRRVAQQIKSLYQDGICHGPRREMDHFHTLWI